MKTEKISLAFFSPTGSTKRVLERMGKRWTEDYEAVMQEINLTKLETEQEKFLFGEQELVFFGTPVLWRESAAGCSQAFFKYERQQYTGGSCCYLWKSCIRRYVAGTA